ncbi:DNA cytosine methyltransferase [Undibacterium arcticum]
MAPANQKFRIPVSDMQAYKQFGNSVVVPVFSAVAKTYETKKILEAKKVMKRKAKLAA